MTVTRLGILFVWCSLLLGGCQAGGGRDSSGFYSYVDAQGNVVAIERPAATAPAHTTASAAAAENAPPADMPEQGQAGVSSIATTPDQLWTQPEDQYMSAEAFEQMMAEKEKNRFVTYIDELGHVRTEKVDLEAVRAAQQSVSPGVILEQPPNVGVEEGWIAIPEHCCDDIRAREKRLVPGEQLRVKLDGKRTESIQLDTEHPAVLLELGPDVVALQLTSWQRPGYVLPSVIFLDQARKPMLLVENAYTQFFPESWRAYASLQGELPVEPGAKWVLLYLPYASLDSEGRASLTESVRHLGNQDYPLALEGDTVITAIAAER